MVSVSKRFNPLFEVFTRTIAPLLAGSRLENLVMCFDAREGIFTVYENFHIEGVIPATGLGAQAINTTSELLYHDRIWFFYETQERGDPALEASINYLSDYRPGCMVYLDRPMLKTKTNESICIDGILPYVHQQ